MEDSDEQSTESGSMIGSNDDLLNEILHRLPAASIIRFKSVSKHWQWLLSDKHFTIRYDKLLKSPGLFLHNKYVPYDVENRSPPPFRRLDFYPDPNGIKIVQSCNGLLLCCSDLGVKHHRKYYVFNPTTKKFAIIPSLPGGPEVRKSICSMVLAFHATHCVSYKVVCIRKIVRVELFVELFQIQIYSSDTGRWKISIKYFSDYYTTFKKGVYWNGAIHWAPSQHNHLYFKIDDEQLHSLPFPVELSSYETFTMYFGESRGHLHLILSRNRHGYNRYNRLHLNVYELLSDHSGWFVKYQVELYELLGASPEMQYDTIYEFQVGDVVRGAEEKDTFMVLIVPGKLITYNVHDKSFKTISSLACGYLYGLSLSYHRYTETLSSF